MTEEILEKLPDSTNDKGKFGLGNSDIESNHSKRNQTMDDSNIRDNHSSTDLNKHHAEIRPEDFLFVPPAAGTPAAEALAANAAIKVSKVTKGIKKIRGGMKGTPNIKSLNIFRRLRKKTKRQRKKNHFARNFKGKVIDGVHELYTLTAGMMLGIRGVVSYYSELHDNDLKIEDFTHVDKQVFPAKGSIGLRSTPAHDLVHTFKFKSYAPKVFGRIRNFFSIDTRSYMQSVCGNYNYLEFIANSKSGQFFFYSHDGKYMIKTQTKEENKFMRKILPHYFKYMTENPHTFLVKIVDMHRVKMYHINRKVHFVIMTSVFDTPEKIHCIYDLKGSMVGRKVSEAERERNPGAVLKDVNFVEDNRKILLGPKKASVMEQLKKDAKFLADLNIMDYSLLFGVHNRNLRTPMDFEYEEGEEPVRSNLPFRKSITLSPRHHLSPNNQSKDANDDDGEGSRHSSHHGHRNSRGVYKDKHAKAPAETSPAIVPTEELGIQMTASGDTADSRSSPRRMSRRQASKSNRKIGRDSNGSYDESKVPLHSSDANGHNDMRADVDGVVLSVNVDETSTSLEQKLQEFDSGRTPSDGGDEEDMEDEEDEYEEDEGDLLSEYGDDHKFDHNKTRQIKVDSTGPDNEQLTKVFRIPQYHRLDSAKDSPAIPGPGITRHPWTSRQDGGINSRIVNENGTTERGNEIYYCGVIDILQQYNASKRIEHFFKSFTNNSHQISAVNAQEYADRFVKFLDSHMV